MKVYKDIGVSGRMYGGGRVIMPRREGRILDADGNPLFVLGQSYGVEGVGSRSWRAEFDPGNQANAVVRHSQ